jgi:hypothetical protein
MRVELHRPPKPEESQKNSKFFNGKTIHYRGFEPRTSGLTVGSLNHCTIGSVFIHTKQKNKKWNLMNCCLKIFTVTHIFEWIFIWQRKFHNLFHIWYGSFNAVTNSFSFMKLCKILQIFHIIYDFLSNFCTHRHNFIYTFILLSLILWLEMSI